VKESETMKYRNKKLWLIDKARFSLYFFESGLPVLKTSGTTGNLPSLSAKSIG
jgi:hypothetical protein